MNLSRAARRSLPYAGAAIAGFVAAYLIVARFVFPPDVQRDVRVPDVIGLQFNEAVLQLANAGLHGVRGEERNHDAAPKGTVLSQSPVGGTRDVQQGSTVQLAVSIGPTRDTAPPLVLPDTGGPI